MIGAYQNYNNSMYRTGFRPYYQTNPWAASQLAGYSIEDAIGMGLIGQVRPFGPWTLHGYDDEGLGQTHPFTEIGGWGLHGLGDGERRSGTMAGLGDITSDVSAMQNAGLSAAQAQTVLNAHNSGALSDTGYNQIVSGNVAPDALNDFLAADAGATAGALDWQTWLQQNAMWIAAGLIGFSVLQNFLPAATGRRR